MRFDNQNQTISWIRDRFLEGQLSLKPPYQRQPVWLAKQKNSLVETVLLNLPVPEVFIQHALEPDANGVLRSKFYVVDGQQRIRTILQFIGVETDERELEWNGFLLDKLPADAAFKDFSYAGLDENLERQFLGYKLSVRMLEDASDQSVRDMFRRLNKFLTKLNDQELRNATYTGPFAKVVATLAELSVWVEYGLVSPGQIRRMKDIEFTSELLIGILHGPQAGSAKAIDEFYIQYDDYDDEFPGQKAALKRFSETLELVAHLLPKTKDSRFRSNRSDFYSLFVATGTVLRESGIDKKKYAAIQKALASFEVDIDKKLANDNARVVAAATRYVRAVQKGANDKARRSERHQVLTALIAPHAKARKA